MLYIDINIQNPEKFETFKKVYDLLYITKPKEERSSDKLWLKLIPLYAREFIGRYYQDKPCEEYDWEKLYGYRDMVTYLQFGFEVEFDSLKVTGSTARLSFGAYAFPYGGMDRFLVFLKAYECIPTWAYNGFEVIQFHWEGDYAYDVTEFPEKTKAYKATWKDR